MLDPRAQQFSARHGLDEKTTLALSDLLQSDPDLDPGSDWDQQDSAPVLSGTAATPDNTEAHPADHLEVLSVLGEGGMGQVLRVMDHRLRRVMAMKVLRQGLAHHAEMVARFIEEAQATAQLEHPGIIPVHELGRLDDGRPYFTMKEVKGRTLADVLVERQHHPELWRLRRLIDLLARVCEVVGYAHSHGVLHRDIKPGNIMVGPFGEVLVLDWGLIKVGQHAPVQTDRKLDAQATRLGQVSGTPRYMSPEQARGEPLDARSDVYAIGATLFEVLSGRPLHPQRGPDDLIRAVAAGRGRSVLPVGLPGGLVEICQRATAIAAAGRYPDGSAMAAAITDWLDDARARERALAVVHAAQALAPEEERLRQEARGHRDQAAALRKALPTGAGVADKRAAWTAEDDARTAEREADRLQLSRLQQLTAALTHAPELPEALSALADHHQRAQALAESLGRTDDAARHAQQLAFYDRGRYADWLRGDGALTLITDPPGATVFLHRFAERDRQQQLGEGVLLGTTPLHAHALPMGSYVAILRAPGCETVRYPVHITRQHHWQGTAPGESTPRPIVLPPAGSLGPDDCYVPAGWMIAGGGNSLSKPRHRLWVDGFVIRRFPVTNAQFIAFLDRLVAEGREEDALRWAPRSRDTRPGEPGQMLYGRCADGRFILVPDAEGDVWESDWPVVMVRHPAAEAYAAAQPGGRWRLPYEAEWEKAARGVDGRRYPWGDHLDPTFLNTRERGGRPMPEVIGSTAADRSVYGVRDMAGNVYDWTAGPFTLPGSDPNPDERGVRGGTYFAWAVTAACRLGVSAAIAADSLGFRLTCCPDWLISVSAPD